MRVFLAVNNNRLIPRPLIIHKLLILRLTRIELREFIALVIRCYVEGWLGFLAADDEGALDDGVILFAIDGRGTEDIFAGGFEAGEEAAWLVCGQSCNGNLMGTGSGDGNIPMRLALIKT